MVSRVSTSGKGNHIDSAGNRFFLGWSDHKSICKRIRVKTVNKQDTKPVPEGDGKTGVKRVDILSVFLFILLEWCGPDFAS